MLPILERLRRKLFRPVPRRKPPQQPRFVRPWLEILEDRTVLDAMLFIGVGGTVVAPLDWFNPANWLDLTVGGAHVPTAADDVGIPGAAGVVAIGGGLGAEVNSIVTVGGTTLEVLLGSSQPSELKIDSNPPLTGPPGFPLSPVAGSNFFGGSVIDTGRMIANTSDPLNPTSVFFAGGATIGPGDLNGNLDAGPGSSFTFTGGGPGAPNTFLVNATLGPGTGSVIIAGTVAVNGALQDNTMAMNVVPGGTLGGAGNIQEWANFNWTGGTISLTGGVTNEATGNFTTSGASGKTLSTTLTNDSNFMNLGGAGSLSITPTGSLVNAVGIMNLSLPTILNSAGMFSGPAGSILNSATLNVTGTTTINPFGIDPLFFTNTGTLTVASGADLTLFGAYSPSRVALDGVLQLLGNLTLEGGIDSPTGFVLDATPGFLMVGDASRGIFGTLTVYAGQTAVINGNVEVSSSCSLTGAGEVVNSGRLQLDSGSSTVGLGSYQQTSIGTLALDVAPGGGSSSVLTVTGTAQLSGTLILMHYTPVVGDAFTVVMAGAIEDHFDTIPDGMEETDGPTSVIVTQVDPPAGE